MDDGIYSAWTIQIQPNLTFLPMELCNKYVAGGGGFMRFFHDQLKYVVRKKFLTSETEDDLHVWLIKFYLSCIEPQLTEHPITPPPAYYDHCLRQLVHHQLQLTGAPQGM